MKPIIAIFHACLCALCAFAAQAGEIPGTRVAFNIQPQPVRAALKELSDQAGVQVLMRVDNIAVDNVVAAQVSGELTLREALSQMLAKTGLDYEVVNDKTVRIVPAYSAPEDTAAVRRNGELGINLAQSNETSSSGAVEESNKQGQGTAAESSVDSRMQVQEITVTASRRTQSVQDVVGTLQAFRGSDLEQLGADGFADYLRTVPGLSLGSHSNGTNKITLRGISNVAGLDAGWGTVSTTGVYLNDIAVQGASVPPDFALYDLERVEVLKGPQGTLYGEGAMGGAIKMVLNAPNFRESGGKGDLSVSSTEGGGFNYSARSAVNLPLIEDRLALRVVGTYRDDEGFVDNVARGEQNHDGKRIYSIRGVLAAEITENLSAEALAIQYKLNQDGFTEVERTSSGDQLNAPEDRSNEVEGTLAALTLKNDFSFGELTSATSHLSLDRTYHDSVRFGRFFFSPVTQDPYQYSTDLKAFSQELRLASEGDERLDWVVGAYYHDKEQEADNYGTIAPSELFAVNAALAAASQPLLGADGLYFQSYVRQAYEQYALYGEGNFELGGGFELTAGLRYFEETLESTVTSTGFSVIEVFSSPALPLSAKYDGVLPKVALSFKASEHNLLYVQAAKGFRSGARNANAAFAGDEGADPDTLWSYEVGSKNDFAGGRVTLNASAFFVDWKGIQNNIFMTIPGGGEFPVLENGGDAEIYGFETELAAAVTEAFTFGTTFGYTHSELVASPGPGVVGSVLPNNPEWTASGYAEYVVPIALGEFFARADAQYVSDQNSLLVTTTDDGIPLDSYAIGNLRFGVSSSSGWRVAFFVDNVWDERAMVGPGSGISPDNSLRVSINPPRTYGLSVSTSF